MGKTEKKEPKIVFISVDEAIDKGKNVVIYPSLGIMFGIPILFVFLGVLKLTPIWVCFVGALLGFGLGWLYWCFLITKWRLWAFKNVQNVHELKEEAIAAYLIYADGNKYEKCEIRSAKENQEWALLQERFKHKDIFIDDPKVPRETIILRYQFNILFVAFAIFSFSFAICFLYAGWSNGKMGTLFLGAFFSIQCIFFIYYIYKDLKKMNVPQIIINEKGMQVIDNRFFEWKDINCVEITSLYSDKRISHFLYFSSPKGLVSFCIDELKITHRTLRKLLKIYHGRHNLAN